MAKVGGTRAFLVMLVHPTTLQPCTVVYDRAGKMRVVTLTYHKFPPGTILDGIVTRKSYTDDGGQVYSDGDWVYLFFDVLLYMGTSMNHALRQCIGVMFGNHVVDSHKDDCFAVQWQKSYPAREFCRVFEEEQDVYNVEGVVFKHEHRLFKWNFPRKRRAVLQMHRGRREHGRIAFDLVALDSAKIAQMTLSEEEFCSMMIRQPLPRMECWWHAGKWTIAKPCTDRGAACATVELDAVKRATEQDISIETIRTCFNTKRA